jgi:hypothetical protein
MKVLSKEKSKVLAVQHNWPLARAEGYVEGERYRRMRLKPSRYVQVGIDDYSLGFRDGFYERAAGAERGGTAIDPLQLARR